MATNKIQTGLRLNELLYGKLKIIAEKENRSLNNLMEYVLSQYVSECEVKNGPIQIIDEE